MRPVIRFRLPYTERGVRLFGDPHIDHPGHPRDLLLSDLEDCKAHGDIGIIMGDVWSAILPQDIKRFTSGRHGEKCDAIINHKLDQAEAIFGPYADCIDLIMIGNHETSVLKYHGIDMISMLVDRLNRVKTTGAQESGLIAHGGYTCWVQVMFDRKLGPEATTDKTSISNTIWLHHGKGGGAPVTRGMIDGARIKAGRTADVFAIAHKHTMISDTDRFQYLDGYGNLKTVTRDYLVVAGYSGGDVDDDPDSDGYTIDWAAETFYAPESRGSVRILFTPGYKANPHGPHITRTVIRESA